MKKPLTHLEAVLVVVLFIVLTPMLLIGFFTLVFTLREHFAA